MVQTQTATRMGATTTGTQGADMDRAENFLRTLDESTKDATGTSLLHILTLASIGASVALFLSGKKLSGIFVGLWPPTFQALKAAADNKSKQ